MDSETRNSLDKLTLAALDGIFSGGYTYSRVRRSKKELSKSLLRDNALNQYFDSIQEIDRLRAIDDLLDKEDMPPYWMERYKEFSDFSFIEENIGFYAQGNLQIAESAISIEKNFDHYKLMTMLFNRYLTSPQNYASTQFRNSARLAAENNGLSYKLFVDSHFFSKKKNAAKPIVRGMFYENYISQGFLNSKTARKIRSEASYEASEIGLKALIKSQDKYSNYLDLILTFTDSRHEYVLCELAREIPLYMLSSLMGTEFYSVKRIIEHRMEVGE